MTVRDPLALKETKLTAANESATAEFAAFFNQLQGTSTEPIDRGTEVAYCV